MAARIFQRSKNAMQSGKARADEWVLQFESHRPHLPDPLTGWSGGADTQAQVTIRFDTLQAAQAYAAREGIAYHLVPASTPKLKIQSYADNFR
ncbi:ETC complex I subunit [Sphingosinicella rhizophila]|uniref:ETC complex I subunit n=1 Tax=Sphingosinicella rhizophila TaxID=3050082 RepID=A0ABU3QDE1_9SPHN|nr:ETC complex I subunit [Sphingosinicella sp. GR2756]MDT9600985.1 ETC complex I subunit [Sphingosinicella sp. GR2756]